MERIPGRLQIGVTYILEAFRPATLGLVGVFMPLAKAFGTQLDGDCPGFAETEYESASVPSPFKVRQDAAPSHAAFDRE